MNEGEIVVATTDLKIDYKIGVILQDEFGENKHLAICNCGRKTETSEIDHQCECGNSNFKLFIDKKAKLKTMYWHVVDKNNKSFRVQKVSITISVDKDNNVKVKENSKWELFVDFVDKKIELYKNGKITYRYGDGEIKGISNYKRFFTQVDDRYFIDLVSTPNSKELLNFIFSALSSNYYYYNYNYKRRIWRGLLEYMKNDFLYIQILANAGFKDLIRFYGNYNRYYLDKKINTQGKNPKEILLLPKFALKFVRDDETITLAHIEMMRKACETINGNTLKEIIEIAIDEGHKVREIMGSLNVIHQLYDEFNYKNLKRLVLYLSREIRMYQGIKNISEGAILLRDYVRMATVLGQSYEQYPKSLKKEHDVMLMNYEIHQNEEKQKLFTAVVESYRYKKLEYKKKNYSIIAPKTIDDLVNEGDMLSHCVASYCDDVINEKCKIYFLRKTNDIETPLVSIEVRNDNVRQVRGAFNRKPIKEEKEFVSKWAKENGLIEAYY